MQLGMIGLGRMGANMVRRLTRAGHDCVVYDRRAAVRALAQRGRDRRRSLHAFVRSWRRPGRYGSWSRRRWSTSRSPTLVPLLERGRPRSSTAATRTTTTTSGAPSELGASGLHYVDVGTSGGVWGLERGYCLMIGGEPTR